MIRVLSRLMNPPPSPPDATANDGSVPSTTTAMARTLRMVKSPVEARFVKEGTTATSIMRPRKLSRPFGSRTSDHSPANDQVAVVEHDGLAGRHSALRYIEPNLDTFAVRAAVTPGSDRCRGRDVSMPDLGRHGQRRLETRPRDQVHLLRPQTVDFDFVAFTDDDRIAGRVDCGHVQGTTCREAQSATLTDGVVGNARMLAEHGAPSVDDRPWPKRVWNPPSEEASVVVVRNETDLLALGLVRRHQAEGSCLLSNFLLLEIAHGKSRGGELILRQGPEKIRLVLLPVAAPPE